MLYSNFDTDPFYAVLDTDPFYDAIPDYAAWPGQMVTKDVAIQLRVRTGQGNTQGIISALTLVMDVPDIGETLNGISISNAGTRLPIAKTYRQIEGVQLTLRSDGGAAVTATVEDHNASVGPLVKTRDAALNPVSGTVNATIQGF